MKTNNEKRKRKTKKARRCSPRAWRGFGAAGFCLRWRRPLARAAHAAIAGRGRGDRARRRSRPHLGGRAPGERARGDAIGSLPHHAPSSLYRVRLHRARRGSCGGALGAMVLIAAYMAVTILSAIHHEEAGMRASFGDQYDAYAQSRATTGRAPIQSGARDFRRAKTKPSPVSLGVCTGRPRSGGHEGTINHEGTKTQLKAMQNLTEGTTSRRREGRNCQSNAMGRWPKRDDAITRTRRRITKHEDAMQRHDDAMVWRPGDRGCARIRLQGSRVCAAVVVRSARVGGEATDAAEATTCASDVPRCDEAVAVGQVRAKGGLRLPADGCTGRVRAGGNGLMVLESGSRLRSRCAVSPL